MKAASDRAELSLAVCELPTYREHGVSLAARRRELSGTEMPVRETELAAVLTTGHMEAWQAYVEDQRTSDGWYMTVQNRPGRSPQWTVTRRTNAGAVSFDSRVLAFAALIARIVGEPLCIPGSGSEQNALP
jgi:hypothetical protein